MCYTILTEPTFERPERQAGDVMCCSSGSVGPRWGGDMNFNMQSLAASCMGASGPTAGMEQTVIRDLQPPVGFECRLLQVENMTV